MKIAESVRLDMNEGVTIDGVRFPFDVLDTISIEPGGHTGLTIVNLPLIVWGTVTLVDREGKRQVVDRELGDVAEWARELVRVGLLEAFPDLQVPA